jgi:hypothetical protein
MGGWPRAGQASGGAGHFPDVGVQFTQGTVSRLFGGLQFAPPHKLAAQVSACEADAADDHCQQQIVEYHGRQPYLVSQGARLMDRRATSDVCLMKC